MYLIAKCFLLHDEFLIMDNAAIHSHGNARVIEDMLWETIVNGHPLHIIVIYLPTCSPELNPI
jgi:transposase